MSRIKSTFDKLAKEKSGAYIPYLCAGDNGTKFTAGLAGALFEGGADILELGMPFSDPTADGPVIQQAMLRSLSGSFETSQIFDTIASLRKSGRVQPILVMSYYNPILQHGVEKFCADLARAGGDAVLAVDLPLEESGELDEAAKANGLDVIRLVTPTTDEERMREISSRASGFIYAVSAAGTTGARGEVQKSAVEMLKEVSGIASLPVALGFGISKPEHVAQAMKAGASGVVEGSRIAEIYGEHLDDVRTAAQKVKKHAQEMKKATKVR